MKKLFYAVALLIGVGFMFASCSKEGVDTGKLNGKWWVTEKVEARFNGQVVQPVVLEEDAEWGTNMRLRFDKSNVIVDNGDGQGTFAYSLSNNSLIISYISFPIVKQTNKELVGDMIVGKGQFINFILPDVHNGEVVTTYKGTKIYSDDGTDCWRACWYFNSKGEAVQCEHCEEEEWDEATGDYVITRDYWFDTERYYFKAE